MIPNVVNTGAGIARGTVLWVSQPHHAEAPTNANAVGMNRRG